MFGPLFDSEGRVYDSLFDMNRDGKLDAGEYCLFDEHMSSDSSYGDGDSDGGFDGGFDCGGSDW